MTLLTARRLTASSYSANNRRRYAPTVNPGVFTHSGPKAVSMRPYHIRRPFAFSNDRLALEPGSVGLQA